AFDYIVPTLLRALLTDVHPVPPTKDSHEQIFVVRSDDRAEYWFTLTGCR
ncbi:unnamed protein product, partial [marine sediment metagenome]